MFGIEQEVENALPQRHLHLIYRIAEQMQLFLLPIEAFDRPAFELVEQVVLIAGDDIDQVLLQCFLIGPRFRFAHSTFGQLDVAAARSHEGTHEGSRIVFHLRLHHVVHLFATQDHGMRRSGVGSGSHGGNVGRLQDEEAG